MTEFAIPLVTGQAACQPAEVAGRVRLHRAGRTDRGLTVMAVAGVAALSALGWVLSYTALRQLALAAGLTPWAAILWPLCVDLLVLVATLAAVADRRQGRPTTYAWTLAVMYSAATVAGSPGASSGRGGHVRLPSWRPAVRERPAMPWQRGSASATGPDDGC